MKKMENSKTIKCIYIDRYYRTYVKTKTCYSVNEVENYLNRFVGAPKDYNVVITFKNAAIYRVECETKKGSVFLTLNVVYEV